MAITREDKLFLIKHLATMIKAGVPLNEALDTLTEQSKPDLGKLLKKIASEVANGQSLGKSMSKFPKVFDALSVSLVNAGEASGTLDENLSYLATQQAKDLSLRNKISGSLLYPGLVVGATVIMGTLLSWFVLPKLVDMFSSFEIDLPWSTKVLMWLANLMRNYGIFVVSGMILVFVGLLFLGKIKPIKKQLDTMIMKIPILGRIVMYGQLGLMNRNLGTLLASGLPVVDAIKITADSLDNLKFRDDLMLVKAKVAEGKTLHVSMKDKKMFEFVGLTVRMIEVGEKSGKLDEMLIYLANFYEEEIENVSKNLSNLLEPVLLLIIGVVVAFVAFAIITPIYSLMGGIR